jgi:hypothetical protein
MVFSRLCRRRCRAAPAGFGLECLARRQRACKATSGRGSALRKACRRMAAVQPLKSCQPKSSEVSPRSGPTLSAAQLDLPRSVRSGTGGAEPAGWHQDLSTLACHRSPQAVSVRGAFSCGHGPSRTTPPTPRVASRPRHAPLCQPGPPSKPACLHRSPRPAGRHGGRFHPSLDAPPEPRCSTGASMPHPSLDAPPPHRCPAVPERHRSTSRSANAPPTRARRALPRDPRRGLTS